MPANEFIGKVTKVNASSALSTKIENTIPTTPLSPSNPEYFKSLMGKVDRNDKTFQLLNRKDVNKNRENLSDEKNHLSDKRTSLIDEINKISGKIPALEFFKQPFDLRIQNVHDSASKAIAQIENVKTSFNNKSIKIKPSVERLLQKKVRTIQGDLKTIYSKLDMEYTPSKPISKLLTPIKKFFSYLSDGQTRLENIKNEILSINKDTFSMSDLLVIQIKVAHVSQEIEFFTSLLNKALESTKSLMNVQV